MASTKVKESELEQMSEQQLQQLLSSLEKRDQESLFYKQYMLHVAGVTEEVLASSQKPKLLGPIVITFNDRRKLLRKARETCKMKLNSQGADKKIEALESEKQVYDEIIEVTCPSKVQWTSVADTNAMLMSSETKRRYQIIDSLTLEKIDLIKQETKFQKTISDNDSESGVRTLVDYQCLRIENEETQKKLNVLTDNVTNIKNQLGVALVKLTQMRTELVTLASDLVDRENDIQTKTRLEERMTIESKELDESIQEMQGEVSALREDMESWAVPEPETYIECVASLRFLERQKNQLSYKLNLLERSLKKRSNSLTSPSAANTTSISATKLPKP